MKAGAAGPEQFFAKRAVLIFALHQSASLENWHDPVDKIRERPWRDGVGQIEAIHTDIDPFHQLINELFRRSDEHRAASPNPYECGEVSHRPPEVWIGLDEGLEESAYRIRLDVFERLIRIELTTIDAAPAAEQCQRAIIVHLFKELGVFASRGGFCVSSNQWC